MSSLKERTRTQISQVVYIPPLKLPEYFQSTPKQHKTKESLAFLQPVPLDQNQQFLKQKSLYRYTISRKLNRFQSNKSVSNLLVNRTTTQNSKEKDQASQMKRSKSKEGSYLSKHQQTQEEKRRHFKRKNRNLLQKSCTQLFSNLMTSPTHENAKVINYQKTNNNIQILSKESREETFFETLEELKVNNQKLTKQNTTIKDLLNQKNKQLERYQQQIKVLKRENQRLIHEMNKNLMVHSESFHNDQKMENQLRFRDTIIDQLQSKIKYIELENFTLKKAKSQCARQADLIRTLENDKKILQEKIKKLYRQKSKRRNMKGSLISECSDLSLNLSFDQEDSDKYFEGLKTSERTPEKVKNVQHYNVTPENSQRSELVTADWKVKKLKK